MKIDLKSPYKEIYKYGYIVTNKEPRQNVILYNSRTDRTTISYARYLMSVHLGRFLKEEEVVDHINNDKMDDRLENYQILDTRLNNIKRFVDAGKTRLQVKFMCPCGKIFIKHHNQTHLTNKKKRSDYCGRVCAGLYGARSVCSDVICIFRD